MRSHRRLIISRLRWSRRRTCLTRHNRSASARRRWSCSYRRNPHEGRSRTRGRRRTPPGAVCSCSDRRGCRRGHRCRRSLVRRPRLRRWTVVLAQTTLASAARERRDANVAAPATTAAARTTDACRSTDRGAVTTPRFAAAAADHATAAVTGGLASTNSSSAGPAAADRATAAVTGGLASTSSSSAGPCAADSSSAGPNTAAADLASSSAASAATRTASAARSSRRAAAAQSSRAGAPCDQRNDDPRLHGGSHSKTRSLETFLATADFRADHLPKRRGSRHRCHIRTPRGRVCQRRRDVDKVQPLAPPRPAPGSHLV